MNKLEFHTKTAAAINENIHKHDLYNQKTEPSEAEFAAAD